MKFCMLKSVLLISVFCAFYCPEIYSQTVLSSGAFYQSEFDHPNPLPIINSLNNSKSVDRTEIEVQHLSAGVWLNYRIRFQNEGNTTVANIRLKDSLSSFLDLNTFQFAGSSHQGQYTLYTSGNLYIYYTGINLPDSATNFSASKGSFRFKIQPKENLPVAASILNSAEIEFDFYPPIYTNTVQTDVVNYTSVSILDLHNPLTVYPNPTGNFIVLDWFKKLIVTQVQIIDLTGRLMLEEQISSPEEDKVKIDLSTLSRGFFFIKVNHQHGVSLMKFEKQ